jgi:hypothetical protein
MDVMVKTLQSNEKSTGRHRHLHGKLNNLSGDRNSDRPTRRALIVGSDNGVNFVAGP